MYAAVRRLYKDGARAQQPYLVGQLASDEVRGVPVLRLWDLAWVRNVNEWHRPPIAELWRPAFAGIGQDHIWLSGLEAQGLPPKRRWFAQRWACEIISYQRARTYFDGPPIGEVQPSPGIAPSPPSDPDHPFE
jgi:hypothetical protein